jgi:hypothetical protein
MRRRYSAELRLGRPWPSCPRIAPRSVQRRKQRFRNLGSRFDGEVLFPCKFCVWSDWDRIVGVAQSNTKTSTILNVAVINSRTRLIKILWRGISTCIRERMRVCVSFAMKYLYSSWFI